MCCSESFEERKRRLVRFRYPNGLVVDFRLVDEVALDEADVGHGLYHSLIQRLVRTDNEEEWIRFTYYRKADEKSPWRFAGQTSLATTSENWRALLGRAMEKEWFKALLPGIGA